MIPLLYSVLLLLLLLFGLLLLVVAGCGTRATPQAKARAPVSSGQLEVSRTSVGWMRFDRLLVLIWDARVILRSGRLPAFNRASTSSLRLSSRLQ